MVDENEPIDPSINWNAVAKKLHAELIRRELVVRELVLRLDTIDEYVSWMPEWKEASKALEPFLRKK